MDSSVFQGLNVLQHATYCRVTDCDFFKCSNMKCLLEHLKECIEKDTGNCVVCKELIALIVRHSIKCETFECKIIYCNAVKKHSNYINVSNTSPRPQNVLKTEVHDTLQKIINKPQLTRFAEPILKESLFNIEIKKEFGQSQSFQSNYSKLHQHFSQFNTKNMSPFDCKPSTLNYQQFASQMNPMSQKNNAANLFDIKPNNGTFLFGARRSPP